MAAVAEFSHDRAGIIWPVSVAPYEVVVTELADGSGTAERLYEELRSAGIDVILDDRNERPGVKFKDAELVGIPYRLTVGPKGLAAGKVELTARRTGDTEMLAVNEAVERVVERVTAERG